MINHDTEVFLNQDWFNLVSKPNSSLFIELSYKGSKLIAGFEQKQFGFLTADIEYVNYRGARFSTADDQDVAGKQYLKVVNEGVKDYYKGNFNFRLGGELKLHTIMFRLGGAFYGSPYKDAELKANRILATGGIGYRDHGIFIDLGYAHSFNKDVVFPYRLNDKPNTFAEQTGSRENVMLTFGFKF